MLRGVLFGRARRRRTLNGAHAARGEALVESRGTRTVLRITTRHGHRAPPCSPYFAVIQWKKSDRITMDTKTLHD
jgi:hypothetical protein